MYAQFYMILLFICSRNEKMYVSPFVQVRKCISNIDISFIIQNIPPQNFKLSRPLNGFIDIICAVDNQVIFCSIQL